MVEDLGPLGLSPDETALYLLMVDRHAATLEDLAEAWRPTNGASIADVLDSLQVKGLVTSLTGRPARHAAIAPDVALDNLARIREEEIARARALAPQLTERWRRAGHTALPAELVEIVVGREATLQRFEQIQRSASEEVLIIDTPPYASHSSGGNALEVELLARGTVSYRCLYDRSGLEIPGRFQSILTMVAAGETARVGSQLPLKMVMGDSTVAMLPLDSAPTSITAAVIIHPSALLTSLRLLFDAMWHNATPVHGEADLEQDPEAGQGSAPSALEQQIIQLLVTGMTDQAIGRQIGLAERTVQRRVQGLMRDLAVDNRLQLGIRLAERGWGRT